MSTIEIEDKSVEDAVAAACKQLQLHREQLEIEVLSKGSSGIFGIVGAKKAKIRVTSKVSPLEAAAQQAKEILTEILQHINLPSVVEYTMEENQVVLNIISNGSGLLIGKRGKTLNALQYLVAKILGREVGENISVIVDTENYRVKRHESLKELARQLSDKVKKSHRPLTTGPMSSQDRRIIHLTLQEVQEVRTKSKGEGNLRRVVIYPVRRSKKPQGKAVNTE